MRSNPRQLSAPRKFLYYHLPVIVYAAAIIAVSSVPNLQAPRLNLLGFDKLAHLIEYAVFSYLTFRSFSHLGSWITATQALALSALFVCFFAVFDELYQKLIPGRQSDIYDFVTDVCGALLVVLFLRVRLRRTREATD